MQCVLALLVALLFAVVAAQDAAPQWFNQRVDHFDHQNEDTFKQLYYVNTTWWNAGTPGPVFLNIGGEGPLSPLDVSYFQEANYAQRFGALLVSLEHRFYGQSQPTGDITTKSLKLLSSQQALADLADFIHHIKSEYNCPNSLVVTFGCSYSGALAAWFRMKYPEVTVGSIAGSAPVHAVADFYEYMDTVDHSLSYFTGAQCDSLISNATAQIQSMLGTAQGVVTINSMFNLCTPLNVSNWLDVATFMSTLMGNFQGVVQYNDDNRLVKPPIDVTSLCDLIIAGAANPLLTYANISNWFLKMQNLTCLDPLYVDSLVDIQNTTVPNDAARQWVYQTCTEFGFFQTTDSPAQPFGNLVPLKYYEEMCNDAYGVHFHNESIKQTNRYYGGNQLPAWGATNIMFVNGDNDPWHTLSVTENVSATVTAFVIENTAHCAHEYPSSPDDSPGLIAARQAVEAQIGAWLYQ